MEPSSSEKDVKSSAEKPSSRRGKSLPTVHLITLYQTPEREQRARKELEKAGLKYIVHRFHRHSVGWKGCISSHLAVYQYALQNNLESIFICEDNIMATDQPPSEYSNLLSFLEECPYWKLIFVGGYILRPWDYCRETVYPQVYETQNNNHGTVCYMIHSRLYRHILEMNRLLPVNIHFDIYLSQYLSHIYRPLMFYHSNQLVSNINQQSDWWRQVWFHPKMMKVHEGLFFRYRKLFYLILSTIIGGIVWYFVRKGRKNVSRSSSELFEYGLPELDIAHIQMST